MLPLWIGCASVPPPPTPAPAPDEPEKGESATGNILRAVARIDRLSSGSDEEEDPLALLPLLCPFGHPDVRAVALSDGHRVALVISSGDPLRADALRREGRRMGGRMFVDDEDESYGTDVAVEERPDGVALIFTPVEPDELEGVMEVLQEQAARLPAGRCNGD